MKAKGRYRGLRMGVLGLVVGSLAGCQTWVGGLTLPSGRYLQHQPQYFAPSPAFPLTRELATQEAVAAAPPGGVVPGPVAPGAGPVVPGPVSGPGPGGMPPPVPIPGAGPMPPPGGAPPAPGGAPMAPGGL
jgi:hypothetical protein